MKVQIFGYGFVGRAHALAFSDDYHVYDPALGSKDINQYADAVIIAVSTPEGRTGACYMENVYDAIQLSPDAPILIKSTISLEGWSEIQRLFPDRSITFSPELLRAQNAMEDFKNQDVVYIGGGNIPFWSTLLAERLNVDVEVGSPEALIVAKYMRNSFLATKVAFFNQVFDLCEKSDINYDEVARFITKDRRIGDSHSKVTDERGFGGHCFPKDTAAIVESANRINCDLSIISEAIEYNKRIQS